MAEPKASHQTTPVTGIPAATPALLKALANIKVTWQELIAWGKSGTAPAEINAAMTRAGAGGGFVTQEDRRALGEAVSPGSTPTASDLTAYDAEVALADQAAVDNMSKEELAATQEKADELSPEDKQLVAMLQQGTGLLEGALREAGAFGGDLSDPVLYEKVYAHIVRMFPDQKWLLDLNQIEGMKPKEARAAIVEKFLKNNPDAVNIAMSDFLQAGFSDLQYIGDVKVDGTNLVKLAQLAQANGMTTGEARRLTRWGKDQLQLEPELFIPAYTAAQDAGTFDKDRTGGLTESVATLRKGGRKVYTLHHGEAFDKWSKGLAKGLELYDSPMLAMVYAHDPDLAQRMATQWYTITPDEATKISTYVGDPDKVGAIPGVKQAEEDWYRSVLEGSGNFQLVDERAVLDAARTIVGSWNMTLGEPQLNNLLSQWKGAQARTLQSQSPFKRYDQQLIQVNAPQDEGAFLRETLRSTGEYGQLFGNKSTAETEQEYVNRFENKSQEYLGDQNIGAVRAGMMSGDPNTVVGQAMASGKAYESSRFRGRLATMADTFRSMT